MTQENETSSVKMAISSKTDKDCLCVFFYTQNVFILQFQQLPLYVLNCVFLSETSDAGEAARRGAQDEDARTQHRDAAANGGALSGKRASDARDRHIARHH